MIDDTLNKLRSQPENLLLLPTFDVLNENCMEDLSLRKLGDWLIELEHRLSDDLREVVEKYPLQ
jgi:hypothetical protein